MCAAMIRRHNKTNDHYCRLDGVSHLSSMNFVLNDFD